MVPTATGSSDICSACGATLSAVMRHCPTCREDAGAPNVRRCRTDENINALASRYDTAQSKADAKGCSKEFIDLETAVKEKSGVVVSMPAGVARKLFEDPSIIYSNYTQLVGSEARKPANFDDDRHRCSVEGTLFGSYAKSIVYGVLSLSKEGLPSYGSVHCRLRSIAIEKRTSFLDTNSYSFIKDHSIIAGDKLPSGYMACWANRHKLVLAKLGDHLSSEQTEQDWQAILIKSDVRKNDSFVEAHIYERFDGNAVESLSLDFSKKLRREDKLDMEIANSKFKSLGGKTK